MTNVEIRDPDGGSIILAPWTGPEGGYALWHKGVLVWKSADPAPEQWSFDMDAAPKDGAELDLFDGIGVVLGSYTWPQSMEEWWETVGEEDEEPDVEGYQEYLEGEMFGWIGCEPLSTDVLYLNPIAWRRRPKPPVPPVPAPASEKTDD